LHCYRMYGRLSVMFNWFGSHAVFQSLLSLQDVLLHPLLPKFAIEPLDANRARFTQREILRGLLVPLGAQRRNTDAGRGFREMNLALKTRAGRTQPSG